jgi:hypothetical protein
MSGDDIFLEKKPAKKRTNEFDFGKLSSQAGLVSISAKCQPELKILKLLGKNIA